MAHKYYAKKVKEDGYTFDSKAEHKRYGQLKLLLKGGYIKDLVIHPKYPIEINGQKICNVILDFKYIDVPRGTMVIEDVKGVDPYVSKLKRKLVKACHNIDVEVLKMRV